MEYMQAKDKEGMKLNNDMRLIVKNSLSSLLYYHQDRIIPSTLTEAAFT